MWHDTYNSASSLAAWRPHINHDFLMSAWNRLATDSKMSFLCLLTIKEISLFLLQSNHWLASLTCQWRWQSCRHNVIYQFPRAYYLQEQQTELTPWHERLNCTSGNKTITTRKKITFNPIKRCPLSKSSCKCLLSAHKCVSLSLLLINVAVWVGNFTERLY